MIKAIINGITKGRILKKKVPNTESSQPIKTESNADNAQNKLINILLIKS